ncbi:MAG: GatB/YqeY domain-containing protein [Candidatus Velthaea sp.]
MKSKITADLKDAMKARDQLRLDTLRSALSAFTYKRVEAGRDLAEDEEVAVIQKQVKQRNDSIAEYQKAGRTELVEKETRERDILAQYLPAQKSADDVREIVRKAITGIPADARNQGAVMKAVMPQLKGQADGNLVRQVVTEELGAAAAGS